MTWSRVAPVLGAFALAGAVSLAAGGAAARPGGLWLGLPPLGLVSITLLVAAALLAGKRTRKGLAACAGFLVPLLLLVSGVPGAGVRVLSGLALLALVFAGAALVVASAGWRPGRVAFLPLAFLVLVAAAGRSQVLVGPQGDEPHYLMVADSLLRDGDLDLEQDYAQGRYARFHDAPLPPHYRVRGRHGEIYSLHAIGLSLLILPAWALAGYAGVTVFMALVSALLAWQVREWTAELGGREDLADAAGWLFVLSPPLLHYAGLVFTEVPAALAVTCGLRRARSERLGWAGALAIGGAVAFLPWLNVRYAPLALVVLAHAVWRHRRAAVALASPLVASVVGLGYYHHLLYGFWDPRRVYGRRPELALVTLREGLPGLFLDQEFGLLVYAPVLVLALAGLVLLLRRDRRLGLAALLAVLATVLTAGSWHMWRGGFNPPGRFLVPVVPILAVSVALVLGRRGLTAGTALLVGWGLWTGIGGAACPQLVHRDRDGTAPFFRRFSGAHEWTSLLPGYVLEDADRRRLALVWGAALLLAVPWRSRRAGAARVAGASLVLMGAAQLAAGWTHARTDDRDAVRLVGRPALAVPGWFVTRAAPGEWSPEVLGWGPLYEPYRHPAGVELGRRLRLSPGRYRLFLRGQDLAPGMPPAVVEVLPDRPGAPGRVTPLRSASGGFETSIVVQATDPAIDVRLRGGGPMLLKGIRLTAQPSAEGAV